MKASNKITFERLDYSRNEKLTQSVKKGRFKVFFELLKAQFTLCARFETMIAWRTISVINVKNYF